MMILLYPIAFQKATNEEVKLLVINTKPLVFATLLDCGLNWAAKIGIFFLQNQA